MLGSVVVSYGSADLLRTHLAHVDPTAREPYRVVVVDNLRSAASREAVRACVREHGWELVEQAGNPGFGAACDAGVERAAGLGCDAVVLVNPDARVDAATLDALAEQVARTPRSLVSPRIVRTDGAPWFTGGDVDIAGARTRNVVTDGAPRHEGWVSGACLATSVAWWRELGGFDPDYFLYWEDVDLSWRATRAGGTVHVRDDLVAVHDPGGTQGEAGARAKTPVYYRYNTRNRLLFAAKHLGGADLRRWVRTAPAYGWAVVLRGGRRQLLRSPRPLLAALRGTLEGLLWVARTRATRTAPATAAGRAS